MWIIQYLSVLGFGFTKISVLLLYKRIFVQRIFQIIVLIVGAFVVIWTVGFFFANFCTLVLSLLRLPTDVPQSIVPRFRAIGTAPPKGPRDASTNMPWL